MGLVGGQVDVGHVSLELADGHRPVARAAAAGFFAGLRTDASQHRGQGDVGLHRHDGISQLVGRDLVQAKMLAEKNGLAINCSADNGTVLWQYPDPDRLVLGDDEVLLAVSDDPEGAIRMIDLRGLPLRKAAAFLSYAGIKHEIEGTGWVESQSVKPGTIVKPDAVCRLRCRPIG